MDKDNNLVQPQPEETVKTKDILSASLKNFRKKHKAFTGIVIALAVILVLVVAVIGILNIDSVGISLTNSLMPKTLTNDDYGIVFYREDNPNYSAESGGQSINVYYYPENDTSREKIYLKNGIYYNSDGEPEIYVTAGFTLGILMKVQTIINALKWVAAALAVVIVVLLIVAWYKSFKKQELAKKEAYRKSHPRH